MNEERILKGGSCYALEEETFRPAALYWNYPERAYEDYGFRVGLKKKRSKTLRGSAFWLDSGQIHSAFRYRYDPRTWDDDFGFRIARRKA